MIILAKFKQLKTINNTYLNNNFNFIYKILFDLLYKKVIKLMKLSYNWLILETPIKCGKKLSQIIKVPKLSQQQILIMQDSPNSTIHPITLPSPLVPFIFAYRIQNDNSKETMYLGRPKQQYQIELEGHLEVNDGTIQTKVLQYRKQPSYIYMLIKLESCQFFQANMTLLVHVKYRQHKNDSVDDVKGLIKLMGSRETNIYTTKTYASIRKEITIEQPLFTQYKYEHPATQEVGYIWMKCTNRLSSDYTVIIHDVKLLNWLAVGKDTLVKQIIESTWNGSNIKNIQAEKAMNRNIVRLQNEQAYSMMFWIKSCRLSGSGVQIPYSIDYTIEGINLESHSYFKMIKFLKIN